MNLVQVIILAILIVALVVVVYNVTQGITPVPSTLDLAIARFARTDCADRDTIAVHDECVSDAIGQAASDIVAAITSEGDETQALLQDLLDTINDGVNVSLLDLGPTAETQLQALMEAALNAVEPTQVEVTNFADVQAVMEAAFTFAANNLQFDVLASQNGAWTVDLAAATITAIQNAFTTALGAVTVDVNITNNPVTVTLDGTTLAALEEINVNVLGQPITVNVQDPITIDNATIAAIATAIAGENLSVTVTGQPISITGTVNLGDVSALTDWLAANDLNIDDAAIIAAINAAAAIDRGDDDVDVEYTGFHPVGCDVSGVQWYTTYRVLSNETGVLGTTTQYYSNGTTLTTTPPTLSRAACRSVNGICLAFQGNAVQSLPVAAGTLGNLKYVSDHGGGTVNVSFSGATPTANSPEFVGTTATLGLKGVNLSLLRFQGTAAGSDYTVCYEVQI